MKILVVGATGGSGRAAVKHLLAEGHQVTAFSRGLLEDGAAASRLAQVRGDVMDASAVEQAVAGHDAVVVTLGISENPFRVRCFGAARTPLDVRSTGTAIVIAAMKRQGVRRLVVQTTFGVGETRGRLRWIDALFFALVLKPQIEDTELQNRAVEESDLDWVLVQPVHLTDGEGEMPYVSAAGETGRPSVTRDGVGRVLARAATSPVLSRQTVTVSAALARAPAPLPSTAG